ncbi:MAG: CopG family transcriptional regulator [Lachnospiraceae bacterium]|nr:CopG family transcriptional regulator [Lachnospiraceae bacterium]
MSEKRKNGKFVVTKKTEVKEEKSINMTLRIDKDIQKQYDEWANKTNRSRNELMCMALVYALENIEFLDN